MALHSTCGLVLAVCLGAFAQDKDFTAPFVPTPENLVRMGLEAAKLQPGELHIDLGSGDGRWVIAAARDFGARSVGYEIDPELVASSRARIQELDLGDRASIKEEDLFKADFRQVDLVTIYLLPTMLERLRPILEQQLKPGARVVSYDFPMPEWKPDQVISIPGQGRLEHFDLKLYVYRR